MIRATCFIGYATYFFGLVSLKDCFGALVALDVVMLLASTTAFPLTEIYGRRVLIVSPQFMLCLELLIISVLRCVQNRSRESWGIVGLLYVWALIYQLSIGVTGFLLASDIATMRFRVAAQGLITITNPLWGLIMQFTVPHMNSPDAGDLGGKVGFIFLATGLIASAGGSYFSPETKRLSFERLDELYAMDVPPRHFKRTVALLEDERRRSNLSHALLFMLAKEGEVSVEHA